jgi:hypothetical protein
MATTAVISRKFAATIKADGRLEAALDVRAIFSIRTSIRVHAAAF